MNSMDTPRILEALVIKQLGAYTLRLSLECRPGETIILTGPSGSGKTTVLRCLAGLTSLDDGYISFAGHYWNNAVTGEQASPQSRRIGFLGQDCRLFPHMDVAENVRFAMDQRADPMELLELIGIGHLRTRRPGALSGGERQRVALCQALARDPQLLLLDEPFSALDLENRRQLRSVLAHIQQAKRLPIIQVTHDLGEAIAMQARIISLNRGCEDQIWLLRQMRQLRAEFARVQQQYVAEATGG